MKAIQRTKNDGNCLLVGGLALCLLVTACGNETTTEAAPPTPASTTSSGNCKGRGVELEDLELETDSGFSLTIVSVEPASPFVGDNAWRIALAQGDAPLVGVASSLEAIPFMPDHGHGTAVPVDITEQEPGEYLFAPINLRMPGYWEITITLSGDAGDRQLMVPVCVK
jgi:YtkA-like